MHLVYIDEVKHDPASQPYYWLGALAIPGEDVKSVEAALDSLASEYFGTAALDARYEFHATKLVQGKGPFSGHDLGARVKLYKRLADVVDTHPSIGRVFVRLDPTAINRPDYQRIAFMFLVERLDQLMAARNSTALLIVDHDREFVDDNVRHLATFKSAGTDFTFGQSITRLVDTVHHTKSHHSRLLQLADYYVYSMCLREHRPTEYRKSELVDYFNGLSNFSFPTKYKIWPVES